MFGKFIQRTSLAISIYVYIHMTRIDIIEFLIILRHCFTLLGIRAERSVEFVLGIGFRVVFTLRIQYTYLARIIQRHGKFENNEILLKLYDFSGNIFAM